VKCSTGILLLVIKENYKGIFNLKIAFLFEDLFFETGYSFEFHMIMRKRVNALSSSAVNYLHLLV